MTSYRAKKRCKHTNTCLIRVRRPQVGLYNYIHMLTTVDPRIQVAVVYTTLFLDV